MNWMQDDDELELFQLFNEVEELQKNVPAPESETDIYILIARYSSAIEFYESNGMGIDTKTLPERVVLALNALNRAKEKREREREVYYETLIQGRERAFTNLNNFLPPKRLIGLKSRVKRYRVQDFAKLPKYVYGYGKVRQSARKKIRQDLNHLSKLYPKLLKPSMLVEASTYIGVLNVINVQPQCYMEGWGIEGLHPNY